VFSFLVFLDALLFASTYLQNMLVKIAMQVSVISVAIVI
jgi:hypothetical protein